MLGATPKLSRPTWSRDTKLEDRLEEEEEEEDDDYEEEEADENYESQHTVFVKMEDVCIISELQDNPFSRRSAVEKTEIVKKGRPCPHLPYLNSDHKEKDRNYTRRFNVSYYSIVPWVAGSSKLNKLFCWPCLLFSAENGVWRTTGFANLNYLSSAVSRHEKSMEHLKCAVSLNSFKRTRTNHQLDEQKRISDELHNENVNKNRAVLKRLIDVICLLGKQKLPFRGHDESEDSDSKGNYIELLKLIRHYDPVLENHLRETYTVFRVASSAIQNELIASISDVVIDKIRLELEQSEFVALILDETSDIINKSQLSIVLRFVDRDGRVQERFIFFSDVSSHRSAGALLDQVKIVVQNFNCGDKLIVQTYDGAAVIAEQVSGLNIEFKELYPNAIFVHCYSHMLNLTLQQSCSYIKECGIFFQTLSELSGFFSVSVTHAFKQFIEKESASDASTRLDFSSRLVKTINEEYDLILIFFKTLLENSSDWDNQTVIKAQGFLSFLERSQTRFLISVFFEIFSFTDVLFNTLQKNYSNIAYCAETVAEVIKKLEEIREHNFMKHFEKFKENGENSESYLQHKKPRKHFNSMENESEYKRVFIEILDNILIQLNNRFQTIEKLDFLCLLDSKLYKKYNKKFPENALKSLESLYGSFFDITRLKNELSVVYSSEELKDQPVFELIKFIDEIELKLVLKEVYKLARLIATFPTTTATAEQKFSASKRIKAYCSSTQGQDRLSSLAVLSIEKALLDELKIRSDFYDEVIQKFVDKSGRLDFIYK